MNTEKSLQSSPEQKIDCEDFLSDINFWTADLAEKLAKENSIAGHGLTEMHWKVILYVRDYFMNYEKGPEAVKVAKQCDISMDELCDLFPCGLVRGAYKVAGLPRPPGCI